MTPEQKFARWVRVSIASFLLMFVYFIVADIWIPLTPDATVMRVVTPVSSRVAGYVAQVNKVFEELFLFFPAQFGGIVDPFYLGNRPGLYHGIQPFPEHGFPVIVGML